jgi:pimeloyl-ACP methyl ester carboxylesterase
MISFLWWALLFVSIFVSPPYMNTRGSGFFDFSYTTLTIGNLLIALLFFAIPSKPMEILSFVITVMLLVNMIMIVAIRRLRSEESWVGVTSVVWATFIAFYNVVQDRAVARGKKREEQRLTGREEVHRPLREWCAVLTATVIMSIMVLVTILLTATLILRARDASLSYEGKRYYVNGDKYEVHLACVGNVTHGPDGKRLPTVLLEAGEDPIEGTFESLMSSAVENGTIHRYCYWDRPGFGWSDNAPSPNSAGRSADDLSEALAIAGEQGPFVLVSAGIGSIYSRIFSSRHVRDVKGIFMIDPFHEDLLYQVGDPGRGFMLWARGVIAPLGLDRLVGALFQGRTREDRVYGKSAYQNGKYIKAKLQENLVADSLTKNEISSARNIQTNKTPLVVVSSGIEVKKSSQWETKQEDLTKITKNLVAWDIVNAAPHEVWKTREGRRVLEKRLGQLLKIASGAKNATSVYH